jgi:hypothetical protein
MRSKRRKSGPVFENTRRSVLIGYFPLYCPNTSLQTKALEPVTPPLSPLSPPPQFFEPTSSDPAFQLPLLSDPPSLTKEDLDSVEEKIWKEDLPTPLRVTRAARGEMSPDATTSEGTLLGDIYSPLAFLDGVTTPPVTEPRKKNEDLKIEETLTPPDPSPIPKMVQFSDFIEEITFPEASPPIEEDLDHFFNDAFGDAGERAMRMVEQETLIAADTTARVKVPILDFSVPDPPWKAFQIQRSAPDLLATQTAFMVDILGQELLKWPGSKQGELKLKWNPFPHAQAKVNTEEDFPQDDSTWESIVFDPEDVQINRDVTVTWKPPGLRILKSDYDNDDEIDPGEFQKKFLPDLSYLVKKRKLEIEERRSEEPIVARPNSSAARIPRKNTPKQNDFMTAAEILKSDKSHAEDLGLLGDAFSTENALDNYLEMRGKKKQKLVESSYFGTTAGTHVQAPLRPTSGPSDRIQLPIRNSPVSKAEPLPAPSIRPPAVPPNLIVSTLLIKNRPLIKQLESQLPGVKLIERDFSAHNSTAWLPNSVTRSPITSSLSSEADINVSPFTGIIITTLQKIKQKALPGQKTKPAIRDRMEKVSIRYERVVVLVSEGRSDGSTNGLDEGGCQALTDFVGFTIGLESNVIIHFVGGGNETLSKWLVSTIVQHSVVGACDLLDDETHWELFLRRAGMNAYAAQAVLGELKAPEGVDPTSPSKAGCFGLVAFVEMDKEQRIARFERLCGRKLLERVSACIDERWE